jgi:cyclohexyl-isocyanide hydratase
VLNAEPPQDKPKADKKMDEAMASMHLDIPAGGPQQIGMLLYPGMFALDLVGPHAILSGLMNVEVHLLWKTKELVKASGLMLTPTTTLEECPKQLDVLFVPGGLPGTQAIMQDDEVLSFLADRGSRARYVTSVCTGSLILGAAGLLKGYKATSHWAARDMLPLMGAMPVEERVVEDRNRLTGGGVTAGMDFGLLLASRMRNRRYAEMLQLMVEYDPHPPFNAGVPKTAGPEITAPLQQMLAPGIEACRQAALIARKRLSLG